MSAIYSSSATGPQFDESGRIMLDDWFAFYFDHNHAACLRRDRLAACEPERHTVHEMCWRTHCCDRNFHECPFHPPGCECSLGECQAI
jgi:hypothetical protein